MKRILGVLAVFMFLSFTQQQRITVFMVGDSTMQTYKDLKSPQRGWGQVFQQFFDTAKVKVENFAMGGRSSRSFMQEGRWQRVLDKIQPGDYVFIQFGHNDGSKSKPERYTSPEEFKKYIEQYVNETRAKGAFPVLLTLTARRDFDSTGVYNFKKNVYAELTIEVAHNMNVPLIDMNAESSKMISELGKEKSKDWFMFFTKGENQDFPQGKEDNTHLKEFGAIKMAEIAAKGIKTLNLPLAQALK
jgi:lysophospholipase L1-like esterase